jgi:Pyruvate/2-oxoacid:ferredoxin oxidoreductase delta subunit/predicted Fe-Mo cluster-binding NifX family protein
MRIAVPVHAERISPLVDVARRFVLLDVSRNTAGARREVQIESADLVARAKRIAQLGSDVLICGAISRPLESMLLSAGVKVIPNTCGAVDEVVAAFVAGQLTEEAFLLPGCDGGGRGLGRGRGRGRGRGCGRRMGGNRGTSPATRPQCEPTETTARGRRFWACTETGSGQLRAMQPLTDESGPFGAPSRVAAREPRQARSGQSRRLRSIATVDRQRCACCAACASSCPEGAITVGSFAEINADQCNGCGLCLSACPEEAISLVELGG